MFKFLRSKKTSTTTGQDADSSSRPVTTPAANTAQEPAAAPSKTSWLTRLKSGLSRTGQSIGGLFVDVKLDEALYEELETALIMADAGMEATDKLLTALRAKVKKERLTEARQARDRKSVV